ncbi:MAG TPA: heme ABC transporter ATP-binding protein [Cyclobacteriaceae bacterium]|nr:heme ABC transporter ATP-binding protein [Cyclobacteriaceae bacterium]
MIEAKHIGLSINGKTLLNDVNLSVQPGTFTAIAGPNGAGKSSLLKILSHELTHYKGEVRINDVIASSYSVAQLSAVRAVLPQHSHVQFPFTVKQIVEMGRQHFKTTSKNNDALLEEVMELTGIADWANRNYISLSGGEQQRVQLARVLAQVWDQKTFPRYVLLDEPTSSLDIAQQQLIFTLVKKACERNIGVLAIVHDLNQAVQFADHLYFMRNGSVIAQGESKEVFTKTNIEETFCCRVNVYHDPCTNCPYIVPERTTLSNLKIASV